ncbi:hypothetical protein CcCBS67573_g09229 [Chytriomyces confervae]|uniref:VWFA domain-containing protein n=1 Tax=Chytriomyces confervae TaxID=246404 RepID=A0A507E1E1_9FUNG|nr:hypothetical protein HDU80_001483 [Chytriomyces hyalinus]TPX57616.1 hypothetical protein CcCBS67573_g09229 [Chytriomyces confervae]
MASNQPPPLYSEDYADKYQQQPGIEKAQAREALRLEAFKHLVERHEISNLMALKLRKLEAYDIVVICDDSGSMNIKCAAGSDPYAPIPTRWDELKQTVLTVTDIASTLDEDGIDVYFLNRPPLRNVIGSLQLERVFADPPRGYTPTARVLRQVLNEKRPTISEGAKKLLVLIATDGVPTTDTGADDRYGLRQVLTVDRSRPNEVPVVFLACTDDESEIGYLNEWDSTIPCIDVADDYYTERRQILAVQGPQFSFSRGDWVCKMLLGPVDREVDALDEAGQQQQRYQQGSGSASVPVMEKKKKKWGWF